MVQMLSTGRKATRGGRQFSGYVGSHTGTERRQGPGIQSWPDGSTYEGDFVNGLKHGTGKFTWNNGEYYEGSFFKDYRHGKGVYCWPAGCTFIGKFYLNRKEGYGQQQFPDGTTFQGLYHADQRFGPGVLSYPDGRQDVGLWHRERLLKLCTSMEGGFTLNNFPEYAVYNMSPAATIHPLTQLPCSVSGPETETRTVSEMSTDPLLSPYSDLLSDERFILPSDMDIYSTDGDHLPVPPGLRRQLDLHFYSELWEAGYDYDPTPLSSVPLLLRMQANIHRHRREAVSVGWDVDAVLSLTRDRFGPKGPLELSSELLIQQASLGDREAVFRGLRSGSVHPDVGDSQGNTALIAATVNCHNDVIHLLLDMGADINKLNSEGMSALAACHVLYYPYQSLHSAVGQRTVNSSQISPVETTRPNRPQINNTVMGGHTTSLTSHSDRMTEELTEQRPGHSSNVYHVGDLGVSTDIHNGWPGDTTTTTGCLEEQEIGRGGKQGENKTEKKGEDNGGEVTERGRVSEGEEREIDGKEEQQGEEEREREEGGKRIIDGVERGEIEQEREVEERQKVETDILLDERREIEAREEDEQGAGERERAIGQQGEEADEREQEEEEEEEEERGARGGREECGKEGFLHVLDGHISLGSVSWLEGGASPSNIVQQAAGEQCDTDTTFDSARTLHSFPLRVTEEAMQCTAEAMSRTRIAHVTDTQETVRKMAAMKTEHRVRWSTLQLLLERGADPNASRTPMPVLFLPIMAAHTEAVRKLLLCGARTDIPLPPERKGLYPLHMAAALPGPEGPSITELLLHAVADVDAVALDQGDIYHLDMPAVEAQAMQGNKTPKAPSWDPHAAFSSLISQPPVEGGRTALHVACQRHSDYSHARDVVSLLLSHRASTHLLWSGHSPLSLAIASGNNLAVEELLKAGADPNLPLGHRVGSALCALANVHYDSGGLPRNRAKLLNILVKAGASILMPVIVGEGRRSALGTAVDYAHHTFNQDVRIARTPYHTLNRQERETFNARRQLLSMMGDLLRQSAAVQRDDGVTEAEESQPRNQSFKFCYRCGRSVSVLLTACTRCHEVFYCSKNCKLKAWNEGHKNECIRTPGRSAKVAQVSLVEQMATDPKQKRCQKTQRSGPKLVQMTGTRQHAGLKSYTTPRPLSMAQKVSESHCNLKENYSFE